MPLFPATLDLIVPLLPAAEREFVHAINDKGQTVETILRQWEREGNLLVFVTQQNKQLQGFITIYLADDGIAIGPMYVCPEARRQGIGRDQVDKLIRWARLRSLHWIRTRTWGENQAAIRIFESLDFERTREIPSHRLNGDQTFLYEIQLNYE